MDENNNINLDEFINYNESILNYEKKIETINKSNQLIKGKGYLVDSTEFNELKKLLNYDKCKSYISSNNNYMINSIFKSTNFQNEDKLVPIDIKSIEYIKSKIINIDCVLITEELFDLISPNNKNNRNIVSYEGQNDKLTLIFQYNGKLELTHKNFFLNILSFKKEETDVDDIKSIYEKTRNYFFFENNLIELLESKKQKIVFCNLVKKDLLDEFKQFFNYEYLKNKYYNDNKSYIRADIRKLIYNEIIEYKEQNKSKRFPSWKNKIIMNDNKSDLEKNIKIKPLVLIENKTLSQLFPDIDEKINKFECKIHDGQISINFKGETPLTFKCQDNIISFNNIISDDNNNKTNKNDYTNENREFKNKNVIIDRNNLNKNDKYDINNVKSGGFKKIIYSKNNNIQTPLNNKISGRFHPSIQVEKKEIDNNKNNNKEEEIEESKFVNNIISFILFLHLFNKDINENNRKKYKNYIKNTKIINGYLINKNFLYELKKIIYYEEISKLISKSLNSNNLRERETNIQKIKSENNGYFNEMISKNENDILQFIRNNYYKDIEFKTIKLKYLTHYYPTNFEIINNDAYNCLFEILRMNNNEEELNFIIDGIGKILIKFPQPKKYNLDKYIFSYILNINEDGENNYILKSILFYNDEDKRNKDFDRIFKGKAINEQQKESTIFGENKEKIGTSYLIDFNNENNSNENQINENEDYTNLKKNIHYSCILYNEYSQINETYKDIDISGENIDDSSYLVNSDYIKEFESLIHFDKIKEIITKINSKKKKKDRTKDEIEEDVLNEVKKKKMENELNEFDSSKLDNLNNIDIYELKRNNIKYRDYFYYQNCQLIDKEIHDILREVDNKFKISKFKSISCLFSEQKAILFLDNKIINIGFIDENNEFVPELLIYIDKASDSHKLKGIYNLIKKKGFKIIEYFIQNGKIIDQESNILLSAKIYNLYEEEEKKEEEENNNIENEPYQKKIIKNNKQFNYQNISEELKKLIIILLSMENTEKSYWRNKQSPEEVYLLNKKYIEQFDKNDIKNLDNKILSIYSQQNRKYTLNEIISKIHNSGNSILEKLDNKIKNKKTNIKINPDYNNLKLFKKNIKICEEFILINKEILSDYNKNIKIDFNNKFFSYMKLNNEDLIIINENSQNIILIGNYSDKNYSFDIKYILDYISQDYLNSEKQYIIKTHRRDTYKYIKENTVFINDNEDTSPIFDEKEFIGTCYKYNKCNPDFSSSIDYSEILSNKNLRSSIALVYNDQKINEYIGRLNEIIEIELYVLSVDTLNKIKEDCDCEKIFEFIKNTNMDVSFFKDKTNFDKELLKSIKSVDTLELSNRLNAENNINKINNEYTNSISDINIVSVNYSNEKNEAKQIMIYNNFELIKENVIDEIIDPKYKKNIIHFPCIFHDGKIIINYPSKIFKNEVFISLIGELDAQNIILPQYILMYSDQYKRKQHIDKIKKNLSEFLENYPFNENYKSDIINENKRQIGIIIKYDLNDNKPFIDNTNSNPTPNDDSTPPEPTDPIPPPVPPEPPTPDKSESIKNNFNEAPLIGLQNIGATCYMNATLQCFSHIEKFVNFFKYNSQSKSIFNSKPDSLTYSFKLLIDKLWPNNLDPNNKPYTYYAPYDFKNKISKMNPLFEGVAANDSKDLVNFIIMTLHEELNKAKNDVNPNDNYDIDQTDKMKVFNNYLENFKKTNKSIISDLFYSTNCSITECSNCHIKLYNYQVYFFIVFPLEEIRKFKYAQFNQSMNNNINVNMNMNMNFYNFMGNNNMMPIYNNFFTPNSMNNINSINMINSNNIQLQKEVDIFDCFNYETKQNVMSGSNAMYCNNCKITCDSYMRTILVTGPEIFILLLNRGKGIEFDVKLNFTEYLDLSNYIEYRDTGYYYKLIGVITHIGESGMGGHFIAYCRDPLTNNWHKYNDAIVSDVSDFQNEVINFAMPYLLFYQKIK